MRSRIGRFSSTAELRDRAGVDGHPSATPDPCRPTGRSWASRGAFFKRELVWGRLTCAPADSGSPFTVRPSSAAALTGTYFPDGLDVGPAVRFIRLDVTPVRMWLKELLVAFL